MATVNVRTAEFVCELELARVDKKNALTREMYALLADGLAAAEADPQVRAILIHGAPDCFCAGNDLKDFLAHPDVSESAPAPRFLNRLATLSKPIIAAVGGPAIGIGTTLLLHCDFIYAATNTRFQLPFVTLGLVPEAGSSLLLPRLLGHPRAAELLLLGRPFDADKAYALGLVTAIVPESDLLSVARATTRALTELPPESVRLTKALMKGDGSDVLARRMRTELDHFAQRLHSSEVKEAIAAFFEKRKPDFSNPTASAIRAV